MTHRSNLDAKAAHQRAKQQRQSRQPYRPEPSRVSKRTALRVGRLRRILGVQISTGTRKQRRRRTA